MSRKLFPVAILGSLVLFISCTKDNANGTDKVRSGSQYVKKIFEIGHNPLNGPGLDTLYRYDFTYDNSWRLASVLRTKLDSADLLLIGFTYAGNEVLPWKYESSTTNGNTGFSLQMEGFLTYSNGFVVRDSSVYQSRFRLREYTFSGTSFTYKLTHMGYAPSFEHQFSVKYVDGDLSELHLPFTNEMYTSTYLQTPNPLQGLFPVFPDAAPELFSIDLNFQSRALLQQKGAHNNIVNQTIDHIYVLREDGYPVEETITGGNRETKFVYIYN